MNHWRRYLVGGRFGKAAWDTVLCVCVLSAAFPQANLFAQRSALNWYFGSNAGVTFANGVAEPLTDGRIDTDEGCAVQSNVVSGKLMFYTDGHEVRNSFHQVMPNGTGLQGESSTSQSALILPWPGNDDLFAIFNPAPITAVDPGDRCICLTYSVVDMRRDAGFGDVIVKNLLVTSDITEHITATKDCDQTGWWVVVRRRESSAFNSYHFTSSGVDPNPVVSASIPGAEIRDAGQMHFSPDGSLIVITSPSGTTQLYRFARSTGELFNGIDLFGSDRSGIHYGASFSADSKYLYVATSVLTPVEGVVISRFDVRAKSEEAIIASKTVVGFLKGSSAFTPLQLAPDGAIYIGRPNEKHLACIPHPSEPSPTIRDSVVALTGICRSGLPYFPSWYFSNHTQSSAVCNAPIAYAQDKQVCVGECVQLVDNSQGIISSWSWDIPGGVPSSPRIANPVVCFSKPGRHTATLTVSNTYGDDTVTIAIDVVDKPTLSIPPLLYTCANQPVLLTTTGAQTYRWNPISGLDDPNSRSPTATVAATTTYTVIGTNSEGCKDTASVTVAVANLSGGADATICPGGSATLHASGADIYEWTPNVSISDTSVATPTVNPGQTTTYTVRLTKGNCVTTDTVVVYVKPSFQIYIEGPSQACSGDVITLRAVGGGSKFTWSGNGVQSTSANEAVVHLTSQTTITVIAQSGNCIAVDSLNIAITDGPVVMASNDTAVCAGTIVSLTANGTADRYQWLDANGTVVDSSANIQILATSTQTYTVIGFGKGACSMRDSVTVIVSDAPAVSAGPIKRICKGSATRLSATGTADMYRWQPSKGLDDTTQLAPIANPEVTTTYILTAVIDGCVSVDSTVVYVSDLRLTSPQNTNVCAGSWAELTVDGAATYQWIPSDGLSDPTIPNPVASPTHTTTYQVIGRDAFGCEAELFARVTVIDTSSLIIRAANITAQAGTNNVELPIFVDANPAILPLFADSLRADIVIDKDVLLPNGFDRGNISTSTRGNERVVRLVQPNVLIVNPQQRINSLYGLVLASSNTEAKIRFEKVEWVGVTCPTSGSASGRILVTGCYIKGRALRFFDSTSVAVTPRPSSNVVDVEIAGGEPGTFVVQLVSVNGEVIHETQLTRAASQAEPLHTAIDMSAVSGGLYYVVTTSAIAPHINRIVWLP